MDSWIEHKGTLYGAQPDERGPIGGGLGYHEPVTGGDFIVESAEALIEALGKAKSGEVVFLPADCWIDLTSLIYIDNLVLRIAEGVTLAGNRGEKGSPGGLLTSDALDTPHMLVTDGPRVRITGLRIEGPNPKRYLDHHQRSLRGVRGREHYNQFPRSRGIQTEQDSLRVDNCEISGFGHAAIHLLSGRGHQIHHNYLHHNQYQGLGYGVCHNTAFSTITYNLFDWNRHSIAGTGSPPSGYEARHNVELGVSLSHCFDMHGGRDRKDGSNTAGSWCRIENNTFMGTETPIVIRGEPEEEIQVSRNWFHKQEAPQQAVIHEAGTQVVDNAYGDESKPPKIV